MEVAVRKKPLMLNKQIKNLWQAGMDNIEPDHFWPSPGRSSYFKPEAPGYHWAMLSFINALKLPVLKRKRGRLITWAPKIAF